MRFTLIDPAMPLITRELFHAREIWIDDALCRAARCGRVALRQRRVAAFVIVGLQGIHVKANRIGRIEPNGWSMRNPRQSGNRFRRKAASDSDRKRPRNPNEGGHPVDRVRREALSAI